MAQSGALIQALKYELRQREMTYADLAKRIRLSESSVKRLFAAKNFSLKRLDQICDAIGVDLATLVETANRETNKITQLSLTQEKELVADHRLLLIAVMVLNNLNLDEIVTTYQISHTECVRCLAKLDRLKIIDLLPGNRVRLRVARNFSWIPDGPIQRFFDENVQSDFFHSRFDGEGEVFLFVSGTLTMSSLMQMQHKLKRLAAEFAELHDNDKSLPKQNRSGTSLSLAMRPWEPRAFSRLRR